VSHKHVFAHVRVYGLLANPTTQKFCLSSTHFFIALLTCLSLPHPIVVHLSQCQCGHTSAHDTLWDIVTTIALESRTHVQREVSHLFPYHIWRQLDIIIIKNGCYILMDIVIVDLIRIYMVQWTLTMITHATRMVAYEKTQFYAKRTPRDDFIPLVIEIYGCLHSQFDSFMIVYA